MNSLSILALAGLTAAMALTADFPVPAPDVAMATLTFVKGGPGAGDVWGFTSEDCAGSSGGKFRTYMEWDRGETTYKVAAGKPIYLRFRTSVRAGMGRAQCMNVSTFTPREGGRYEMLHEADGRTCQIYVRDLDNHRKPPPDLIPMPISKACKKAGYLF